jgi:hypothetical protein
MEEQQKMINAKKDEAEAVKAAVTDTAGKMNVLNIDVDDDDVDIDNI